MAYCSKCGEKLDNEAKFCNNCGESINTYSDGNQLNYNLGNADKPLMVLNGSKVDGLIKRSNCFVSFFNDEVVFAFLTKELQNKETKELQKKIKEEGKGFFKGSAEMMKYWSTYGNKYYNMAADEILQEEKVNFRVCNSDIKKIKFTASETGQNSDNYSNNKPGSMIIETTNGKIKINHKYFDSNKNIKKALTDLFEKKLKYKGRGIILSFGNKNGFI